MVSFPFGKYPAVELVDRMVFLFLIFRETSIVYAKMAAPIYIPTSSTQVLVNFVEG